MEIEFRTNFIYVFIKKILNKVIFSTSIEITKLKASRKWQTKGSGITELKSSRKWPAKGSRITKLKAISGNESAQ